MHHIFFRIFLGVFVDLGLKFFGVSQGFFRSCKSCLGALRLESLKSCSYLYFCSVCYKGGGFISQSGSWRAKSEFFMRNSLQKSCQIFLTLYCGFWNFLAHDWSGCKIDYDFQWRAVWRAAAEVAVSPAAARTRLPSWRADSTFPLMDQWAFFSEHLLITIHDRYLTIELCCLRQSMTK